MERKQVEGIDPLPAIEGLEVSGKAAPGQEIQACGFSINGTTTCNFAWVRGSEEDSMNCIEGANTAVYRVTQDDINSFLAIDVVPVDDRGRKGEIARAFANDKKKIQPVELKNPEKKDGSGAWKEGVKMRSK